MTWKRILIGILIGIAILCIIAIPWVYNLNQRIVKSLSSKELSQPTRFYAGIGKVRIGQTRSAAQLKSYFTRLNYRKRGSNQPLRQADYREKKDCSTLKQPAENSVAQSETNEESDRPVKQNSDVTFCLEFHSRATPFSSSRKVSIGWSGERIVAIRSDAEYVNAIDLEALEFAQFLGDEPILRNKTNLGKTPTSCLNAVLAIEDAQFLKHKGISITGIFRMIYVNIIEGGFRQGGSTITQQVVRNSWLTLRKTIKRKVTEMVMAILLELHVPKDDILEMYLNIIYMGQNGPYQVRGFKAAADHYFQKDLEELNLPECALLAAVLNSPGLYNPFTKAENAKKRRTRVLTKMLQNRFITLNEFDRADHWPLPTGKKQNIIQPTLWFVESIKSQMSKQKMDLKGTHVLTTMDLNAQIQAYNSVKSQLKQLDKKVFGLNKKLASRPKSKTLQAALLSADVETGEVLALIGGRDYRRAPFNRALSAHRQIGSNMKPLIYLTALESLDENGNNYTPLHPILDEKFTHKFGRNDRQQWSPNNYSGKTFGKVPLYWALKNSLNISTAKLGLKVGLDSLIDVSRRIGVNSKLKAMPALTLGSFEMYPIEVLKLYLTMARFGRSAEPHLVKKIIGQDQEVLFKHSFQPEAVFDPNTMAVLVGMMKQTVLTGTGKSLSLWRGLRHPAAGKTGTTSEERDAWFSGFTPYITTVVWVGYDDNTSHQLTGASGAIPIWSDYMNAVNKDLPLDDFKWPEGVRIENIQIPKLENRKTELVLRKSNSLIEW